MTKTNKKQTNYVNLDSVLKDENFLGGRKILFCFILTFDCDPRYANRLSGLSDEEAGEVAQKIRFMTDASAGIPVSVIMDGRRLTPGSEALGMRVSLRFKNKAGFGVHHSKAYFLVGKPDNGENRYPLCLVLGSFNLTGGGLFKNREVLNVFQLSENSTNDWTLFAQFRNFLSTCYSPDNNSDIKRVIEYINQYDTSHSTNFAPLPKLIASGYVGSYRNGLSALKKAYSLAFPNNEPTRLAVVSPFFDKNNIPTDKPNNFFANRLLETFPAIKHAIVATDEAGAQNLQSQGSPHPLWALDSLECCQYFILPRAVTSGEMHALSSFNSSNSAKPKNDEEETGYVRPLHAKLLILTDDNGDGIVYSGSANFTLKAWGEKNDSTKEKSGNNFELGVVQRIENFQEAFDQPKKFLKSLFHVSPKECHIDSPQKDLLSDDLVDEDDTDIKFPTFLEQIVLKPKEETCYRPQDYCHLVFIKSESSHGELKEVQWNGRVETPLMSNGDWVSHTMTIQQAREFLGNSKTVKVTFLSQGDEQASTCVIPFTVDSSMITPISSLGYPNLESFMQNLCIDEQGISPNMETPIEDEYFDPLLPNEVPSKSIDENEIGPSRSSNPSVRVQRFIRDFDRLTLSLSSSRISNQEDNKRIASVLKSMLCYLDSGNPINSQVHSDSLTDVERVFYLGEIVRCAKKLNQLEPIQEDITELFKKISKKTPSTEHLQLFYLEACGATFLGDNTTEAL